jgi:hypothetical protein
MADDSDIGERKRPGMPQIREITAVLTGELAARGDWLVANVQTSSFWPVNPQKVQYRGEEIWILPIMNGYFPSVAMKVPAGKTRDECLALMMRFLSNLSWVERHGIIVEGVSGGSMPRPLRREKTLGFSITEEFDLSYFPQPTDRKALLALALMREGRGLSHSAYAFLSFYRVLEVAVEPTKRGAWIEAHLAAITDHRAKEAIAKLRASGVQDIGNQLYRMNRQAIAHATKQPIIDPDEPSHGRRLAEELPIMMGLAELAIEEVFGVETSSTVYRKHLYELAGFKEMLGERLIAQLVNGEACNPATVVDIPFINVRIRRREPYAPLEHMEAIHVGQVEAGLTIVLASAQRTARLRLRLDFAQERLICEPTADLAGSDIGTADSAEDLAELKRFFRDFMGNGQLHIYNADTGGLIARKESYLPKNVWVDHDGIADEIASWKRIAEWRRQRSASVGNEIIQRSDDLFLSVAVTFHPIQLDCYSTLPNPVTPPPHVPPSAHAAAPTQASPPGNQHQPGPNRPPSSAPG